ncbi:MAG: hypothetical protein MHMPM18_002456 [Marteilia pararefringens]
MVRVESGAAATIAAAPNLAIVMPIAASCQILIGLAIRHMKFASPSSKLLNASATILLLLLVSSHMSPLVFVAVVCANFMALRLSLLLVKKTKITGLCASFSILISNLTAYCLGFISITRSALILSDNLGLYIWSYLLQRVTQVAFHYLNRYDIGHSDCKKNDQQLRNFIDYVCYCFGYIGLLNGPHFDVDNYLNIFYGAHENNGKTICREVSDKQGKNDKNSSHSTKLTKQKFFQDAFFYTRTLIAALLIYLMTDSLSTYDNPIIEFLREQIYLFIYLKFTSSILIIHALSFISLSLLDYDKSIFLFPAKSDRWKKPNSIKLAYMNTSLRDTLKHWNRSVVMWFDLMFRRNISSKYMTPLVFATSLLWHGPVYNYCMASIFGFLMLLINKNHHKLLINKRRLQWLNEQRNTKKYTALSWIITTISISFVTMMIQRIGYEELNDNLLHSFQTYMIFIIILLQYFIEILLV